MSYAKTPRIELGRYFLLLYLIVGGSLSWYQGQDVNWDLLNYHFYNPYHLLHGRSEVDFQVAGLQTFFNPILDLPFYLAVYVWAVPPLAIGLTLGALHGVNLWLVHQIAVLLVPDSRPALAAGVGLSAGLAGAFGAGFYSEIGTTMGDATISIPILWGLLALLRGVAGTANVDAVITPRACAIGAFVVGLGAGAKLVGVPFLCAFVVGIVSLPGRPKCRLERCGMALAAAATGLLATSVCGWSSCGESSVIGFSVLQRDLSFTVSDVPARPYRINDWADFIAAPLSMSTRALASGQAFQDHRIAMVYVGLLVVASLALWRRWRGVIHPQAIDRRLFFLLTFAAVSFGLWYRFFRVYRYLVPLELLAAPIALGCLAYIIGSGRRILAIGVPAVVVLLLTTKPPTFGRTAWSDSYFGVEAHALEKYRGATVLMWDMPDAYLVPFFPASTRFVRVNPNWIVQPGTLFNRLLISHLLVPPTTPAFLLDLPGTDDQHPGSTAQLEGDSSKREFLAAFGLFVEPFGCEPIRSHMAVRRMCPLRPLLKPPALTVALPE